jgi:hypothetical protein
MRSISHVVFQHKNLHGYPRILQLHFIRSSTAFYFGVTEFDSHIAYRTEASIKKYGARDKNRPAHNAYTHSFTDADYFMGGGTEGKPDPVCTKG